MEKSGENPYKFPEPQDPLHGFYLAVSGCNVWCESRKTTFTSIEQISGNEY